MSMDRRPPQPRCGSGEERNLVTHRILRNNTIGMDMDMISEERVSVNIDLSPSPCIGRTTMLYCL